MTAMTQLLHGQGMSLEQLDKALDNLPVVEKRQAAWVAPSITGEDRIEHVGVDDRYFVVDRETGQDFCLVSEDYQLVQHREVLQPIIADWREKGLYDDARAVLYTNAGKRGGARVSLAVLFPSIRGLDLGDSHQFGMGLLLGNSVDTSRSLTVQVMGVNGACDNGLIFGKEYFGMSIKHTGSAEKFAAKTFGIEEIMAKFQEKAQGFGESLLAAREVIVPNPQVVPVLKHAGYPERVAKSVQSELFTLLSPEQRVQSGGQVSLAVLFDAVTAWYSHRYGGSPERTEWALENAHSILDVDMDDVDQAQQEIVA